MVDERDGVARDGDPRALQWLLAAYRAMVPVKDVVAYMKQHLAGDSDDHWSSLAMQETILVTVVRDAVCDRFPPHKSYVFRFLKSYMGEIEAVDAEAHDELVEELLQFVLHARLGQTTLSAEDLHHVSYAIPAIANQSHPATGNSKQEPLVVTCRVASVFNEVGLKIWEAGWYLAEYIITHPHVFTDQTVLELGAGVGFTSLVLAGVAQPKRVLLSDYGSSVMQNLRYNAEINAPHFQCPVDVLTLDWDTWDPSEDEEAEAALRPDILLAGDCVYDVASFPSLVRVLQVFLGSVLPSGATMNKPRERSAIFAATIRNQKTFQAFLDHLEAFEIAYEDITTQALETMGAQMFPYGNRHEIRLCVLTRADKAAQ